MDSGVIFDIKRYSIHDGPGIRTTIFLKGCPLSCWWCHNPESHSSFPDVIYRPDRCIGCGACEEVCPERAIELTKIGYVVDKERCTVCRKCALACPAEAREVVGEVTTVRDLVREIEKDILFFDESGGGATFSGGEPLFQPDFLIEVLKVCRHKNIHTVVDTCGYAPQKTLETVARLAGLLLFDLKIMDAELHKRYTGVSNELILSNLKWLSGQGFPMIVRVPVIPGINDTAGNMETLGKFLSTLPLIPDINLLPYHSSAREKYRRLGMHYPLNEIPAPSGDQMVLIAERLAQHGLNVSIGG